MCELILSTRWCNWTLSEGHFAMLETPCCSVKETSMSFFHALWCHNEILPYTIVWPYCGHLQLHIQFWSLDQLGDSLIQLTIAMNLKDSHFKFHKQNQDAKVSSSRSKWSFFSLLMITRTFGGGQCVKKLRIWGYYFFFTCYPYVIFYFGLIWKGLALLIIPNYLLFHTV